MIKIQNNTATRDPLPAFLIGLKPESLLDLSWTDVALGVSNAAWWPEDRQWPEIQPGERYTEEVFTIDAARSVVVSTRDVEPDPDYVPPPPPSSCTPAQGLMALYALKAITEDDILAAINTIEDATLRYQALISYRKATVWERVSESMQVVAQLMGLTEADLDELFTGAVTYTNL